MNIAPKVDIVNPTNIGILNLFLALSNKYKVTLVKIVFVLVSKLVNKEEFFSLLIKKLKSKLHKIHNL